ncbi:hypothetical protein [Poseidonocella sedimentorum]|uniref:Uncharacterized protein n=1 Tax=Poseidonocella sedimentorum TaxID=871652 RepID=A0A1I6CPG4_9RHOB|nr:hypothetical protein [Poseidonocella sedimentorum]SFQ95058.1 hypothetical protein SAMN04515673_101146 [Poseidonocella sedimentorum]
MTTQPEHIEQIASLSEDASAYLDAARGVAISHFGDAQVRDIPLLVTQTAQLMADLCRNRLIAEGQ